MEKSDVGEGGGPRETERESELQPPIAPTLRSVVPQFERWDVNNVN